jgi:outer membrane protein OmpA-like peptidoglycan-associated protein
MDLSVRRAEAVKSYIAAGGVDGYTPEHFRVKAKANLLPIILLPMAGRKTAV